MSDFGSTQTNSTSRNDYAAYRVITARNIFDTKRSPRLGPSQFDQGRPARSETLSLVGTLSSQEGRYAFFDGSRPEYRKAVPKGTRIARLQIAQISGDRVQVQLGTNALTLSVGAQLRRDEERDWQVVRNPNLQAQGTARVSFSETATTLPSGQEDEVVKRLMQQREQELK
jgi:hypothetical protein